MKIAFLEQEEGFSTYAVRKTALSNAERFGFERLAQTLVPRREKQRLDLAQATVSLQREQGLKVRALAPAKYVRLSVNPFLLHPSREHQNQCILLHRARRLGMRIARASPPGLRFGSGSVGGGGLRSCPALMGAHQTTP